MPVWLIGPSGAGKSTVGPLLAARLGLPFVDVDAELERRHGASVVDLFTTRGEPGFRELEAVLLAELGAGPEAVVALGAGALDRSGADAAIRARGPVVLLDCAVEALVPRLASRSDRPLLAGQPDLGAALRAQREARDPRFRAVADLVLDSTADDPEALAAAAAGWLDTGPRGTAR